MSMRLTRVGGRVHLRFRLRRSRKRALLRAAILVAIEMVIDIGASRHRQIRCHMDSLPLLFPRYRVRSVRARSLEYYSLNAIRQKNITHIAGCSARKNYWGPDTNARTQVRRSWTWRGRKIRSTASRVRPCDRQRDTTIAGREFDVDVLVELTYNTWALRWCKIDGRNRLIYHPHLK